MNSAATMRHMSGGQFSVPLVIRMATGGGRQLAAQHSHSLEGWYAHIPGIRVLAPGTVEDARGMLAPALDDPDPVLIFENALLYNNTAEIADTVSVDIDHAAVRREGSDISLVTYGGSLGKTLAAAEQLAKDGVSAEVLDLRVLRPLDEKAILVTVAKTRRAVIVDEGWRSGSLAAEIVARIVEGGFWNLDAPIARVCSAEVPIPYARHLELAALPSAESIVAAAHAVLGLGMSTFRMPSLGADMEAGTLVEWLKQPGEEVRHGDIIAVVETEKGAIEVEVVRGRKLDKLLVEPGTKVPVGTPLAEIGGAGGPPPKAAPVPAPAQVASGVEPVIPLLRQPCRPRKDCMLRLQRAGWPRNAVLTLRRSEQPGLQVPSCSKT